MSWVEQHPYLAAIIAAASVVLLGTIVVVMRSPVSSDNSQIGAWGGGVSVLDPSSYAPTGQVQTPSILDQVKSSAPYAYIPPTQIQSSGDAQAGSGSFDFTAFASQLSQPSQSGAHTTSSGSADLSGAYSYIPKGLISLQSSLDTSRSATQQALYEYGNEVGSFIQSFESGRPDMPQILKNQIEDRNDPQKIAAVVSLANDLTALGDSIANIDNVPPQVASAHTALVKSYRELGAKLPAVARAKSDQDLLSAINTYDDAANRFARNYVALVQILSGLGVTFGPEDPGSVFTFSPKSL